MRRLLPPFAVLVLALVPAGASAQSSSPPTPLAVTGIGVVEARPDRAEVRYVLRRDAGSREAARASVARRTRSLVGRLRRIGVAAEGIRVSRVNIGRRGRTGLRRPFRAIAAVAARTPAVGLAGRMVDLGPPLGAGVSGPSFSLLDDLDAREAATARAVTGARRRAEAVARGLDLRIVGVRSISLDGAQITPSPAAASAPALSDSAAGGTARVGPSTPSVPGTIRVRATVTVNFDLAPA